ncbi:hypothetical protein ACEPAH_3295 [Sanghuangporus vaninii]
MEKRKYHLDGRANGNIDPFYGIFLGFLPQFGHVYNIPDARLPPLALYPTTFFNDNRTRSTSSSKNWTLQIGYGYPFGPSSDAGTRDSFSPGRDREQTSLAIQNTTFGGMQGFTRKPSTPIADDSGNFAGIKNGIGMYALIADSGHEVPEFTPEAACVLLICPREQLIRDSSDSESVVGGEDSSHLMDDILPGESATLFGSGTVTSVFVAPSATIAS